jgi:CubicO group peptidase (beta-lactamase class C family)
VRIRASGLTTALVSLAGFVGCGSAPPAPVPNVEQSTFLAKAAATTSVADRFALGAEARVRAGLGWGYVAAIRENGVAGVKVAGNRTLEPVTKLSEQDLLDLGKVTEVFTGILLERAELDGKLKLAELPVVRDELGLRVLLEKAYRENFKAIVEKRLLVPLGMRDSGVERRTRRRGKWISRVAPTFALDGDPVVGSGSAFSVSALDMAKFLTALENPPEGKLGQAITADLVSGRGWDAPAVVVPAPGVTPSPRLIASGPDAVLVFDRAAKKSIYVATNTRLKPRELAVFAVESSDHDSVLGRALAARIPSSDELLAIKGAFHPSAPSGEGTLRTIDVFETLGHLVARYDFGDRKVGALLVAATAENTWNVVDGIVDQDEITVTKTGLRATLRFHGVGLAPVELMKVAREAEKYPALEK